MKHIYGAAINGKLIAVHDYRDIVEDYINKYDDSNEERPELVKIVRKTIKNTNQYEDLYLIKYGDNYVPAKYYNTNDDLNNQVLYDLKYARDVILRILEYRENGSKSLEKTLLILEDEIRKEEDSVTSIEMLRQMKELDDEWRDRI